MTLSAQTPFLLETSWTPAADGEPLAYTLALTNRGEAAVSGFRLFVSGPGRIDPAARIEGGTLVARLSNHTGLEPEPGFALAAGSTWRVTARALSYPLRHWSEGANTAYVELSDGTLAPVAVNPTQAKGDNAPLRKGAAVFPVSMTGVALDGGQVPVSVVPWPSRVALTGTRPAPEGLDLLAEGDEAKGAAEAFADLADHLFPAEALARPAAEGGLPVRFETRAGIGAEGYALAFAEDAVTLRASGRTGFLHGLVTLGQILRGARRHRGVFAFPASGTIEDAPHSAWRGLHLDVSRQFYASAEVAQLLRIMAWNKLNRFHWHLSDDEGWRVEIDAFPELTEIGAWRGHGLPLPPLLGSGPERWGGCYTKDAVRRIVALGQSLGIETVPEIDIPGHCYAVLQSLPSLRDPKEAGEYASVQGFPNNCLNPAHEPVYAFLETVIAELAALFPAKIIHVGADEVPLAAWSGSPLALGLLERVAGTALAEDHARRKDTLGNLHGADEIEGSPTAILQAEFLRRVQAIIVARGCTLGGWEEAAHGDVIDRETSYVVGWRDVGASASLARRGYNIVVSPGQRYYLDMANGAAWSEPGAGWAGWSGPRETYDFDPVEGWSEAEKLRFLGVQACIWSESMTDRAIFDRLVFPRLSAVAETGWTAPERKSWARFSGTVGLMPILHGNWDTSP